MGAIPVEASGTNSNNKMVQPASIFSVLGAVLLPRRQLASQKSSTAAEPSYGTLVCRQTVPDVK